MNIVALASISFFSLLIGGFITVLVYRLPLILQRQWQIEHSALVIYEKPFNLLFPSSHCPNCEQILCFLEKLPLFAYLFLKGKCAYCQKKIHLRYPLIEILTAICSGMVAYRFNFGVHTLAALMLTWGLIAIGGIDFEQYLIPDILVLPLLWLGLLLNAFHVFVPPETAILGACLAYLSLWVLAKIYYALTKREGMGHGDFKCFALLGAWLGCDVLINILLIASLLGSIVACTLLLIKKHSFTKAMPFGPYLAIAGWLVLVLGAQPLSFETW